MGQTHENNAINHVSIYKQQIYKNGSSVINVDCNSIQEFRLIKNTMSLYNSLKK